MDNLATPALPYAVLRVDRRKAKAMGAIAAGSAHQMRQRPTPNADPAGLVPLPLYLAAGDTPYQAVCKLLEGAERRNKDTVLCREIILSASPAYFRPGRAEKGGEFDPNRTKSFASAAVAWAKRKFPEQLASAILHLDEMTPHLHLFVVPRIKTSNGIWKLNSKALFDRARLRELQTSFGEAMRPLGIRRGEPGSQAVHTSVRQFYGALNRANLPLELPKAPPAPKPPAMLEKGLKGAFEPIASALGLRTAQTLARERYDAKRKAWFEQMREHRENQRKAWQQLQEAAALAPLLRRRKAVRGISEKPALQENFPRSRARGPI